jgi:hypothetical protein
MKNRKSWLKPRSLFASALVVVAALAVTNVKSAQAYTDKTVVVDPASPLDHTDRIQAALNDTNYDRIILPYRTDGWISRMLFINRPLTLWIKGSGSTPGKLVAKRRISTDTPSTAPFHNDTDSLITIYSSNVHINGYSDFVNKSTGAATLQMWKIDYANTTYYNYSPYRNCIRIINNLGGGNHSHISIKGLIARDSGGDGIKLDGGEFGTDYIVTDVDCNNNYRNGMSVVSADSLTIRNSFFRNSSGALPEAGIDFEPNAQTSTNQSRLTNIQVWDSIFEDNGENGVQVQLMNFRGTGVPAKSVGIYFYNSTIDDNKLTGIECLSALDDGPGSGSVYFQGCTISDSAYEGVFIGIWDSEGPRVIFNGCTIINNAMPETGKPKTTIKSVFIAHQGAVMTVGNVLFQNTCKIYDNNLGRKITLGSSSGGTLTDNIEGYVTIYYKSTDPAYLPVYWYSDASSPAMTHLAIPY